MLDHSTAEEARDHILEAIKQINLSLLLIEGRLPEATYNEMKRAAGITIGMLDVEYLFRIFKIFPELDDVEQAQETRHIGPDIQADR